MIFLFIYNFCSTFAVTLDFTKKNFFAGVFPSILQYFASGNFQFFILLSFNKCMELLLSFDSLI